MKFIVILHVLLFQVSFAQNNLTEITSFVQKSILPENKTSDTCVCSEVYFIEHKDIKIIQCYTIPLWTYDSLDYCFSNYVYVYGKLINIDSIYHSYI